MNDRTVARLRWLVGTITGICFGFLFAGSKDGFEAHPVRTGLLCVASLALLAVDWLVLDDNDDDRPY